jgi:8-oxo-dGTP pyrophosphatase MutT (NUDIX family)
MITLPADLPAHLAKALTNPPPHPEGEQERNAAVLLPLYEEDGEWFVLFTRRTHLVLTHRGQVSFPGGMADPGDHSPLQTALREAEEELGLRPQAITILGALPPTRTTTGFYVTPIVGQIAWPIRLRLNRKEVARTFGVPLRWLADGQNQATHPGRVEDPVQVEDVIVYEPYDGEVVWGATARMLKSLIDRLPASSP